MHTRFTLLLGSLLFIALTFSSCQLLGSSPDKGEATLQVRYGLSFGECLGERCWQEMELTEEHRTLTFREYFAGEPTSTFTSDQTDAIWQMTRQFAASNPLQSMDDVYGCPDCADGGAEWITIQQGDRTKTVTFEYGHAPDRIEAFVEFLRSVRAEIEA